MILSGGQGRGALGTNGLEQSLITMWKTKMLASWLDESLNFMWSNTKKKKQPRNFSYDPHTVTLGYETLSSQNNKQNNFKITASIMRKTEKSI